MDTHFKRGSGSKIAVYLIVTQRKSASQGSQRAYEQEVVLQVCFICSRWLLVMPCIRQKFSSMNVFASFDGVTPSAGRWLLEQLFYI